MQIKTRERNERNGNAMQRYEESTHPLHEHRAGVRRKQVYQKTIEQYQISNRISPKTYIGLYEQSARDSSFVCFGCRWNLLDRAENSRWLAIARPVQMTLITFNAFRPLAHLGHKLATIRNRINSNFGRWVWRHHNTFPVHSQFDQRSLCSEPNRPFCYFSSCVIFPFLRSQLSS